MNLTIVQPAQGVIEGALQFFRRAVDGLINGGCFIRDRDRLVIFKARFHHATLVVASALGAIFVAEMNFHAGDVLGEMSQNTFHGGLSLLFQLFAALDVVVVFIESSWAILLFLKTVDGGGAGFCRHLPGRDDHHAATFFHHFFSEIIEQVVA